MHCVIGKFHITAIDGQNQHPKIEYIEEKSLRKGCTLLIGVLARYMDYCRRCLISQPDNRPDYKEGSLNGKNGVRSFILTFQGKFIINLSRIKTWPLCCMNDYQSTLAHMISTSVFAFAVPGGFLNTLPGPINLFLLRPFSS